VFKFEVIAVIASIFGIGWVGEKFRFRLKYFLFAEGFGRVKDFAVLWSTGTEKAWLVVVRYLDPAKLWLANKDSDLFFCVIFISFIFCSSVGEFC